MTWTSPFTAVTGAVITAAGWNTSGRDNLNHLRALLPDPGAANRLLTASSTSAAAFSNPSGDTVLAAGSITGNSGTSAIGSGVIHGNRMIANTFDTTQVAHAFATGAFDATNVADIFADGAINGDAKLAEDYLKTSPGSVDQTVNVNGGTTVQLIASLPDPTSGSGVRITGSLFVDGGLAVVGGKARISTGKDGNRGQFHANETPEPYFEDFGRTVLVDGAATVMVPPDFANFVHLDDYIVTLTPEGPVSLYVAARSPDRFVVRSLGGEDVTFSWRISARQFDLSVERLAPLMARVR